MDALLLDYNGVVVDDEPLHFASFRDVLAEHGIALDESTYYADYLGSNDRTAFAKAMRRDGRTDAPAAIQRLVARKAQMYAMLALNQLVIVPGVGEFVRLVARDARVAVVSGALRREIESGLALAGIRDEVAAIVSAEDVTNSKPDPEGFRLALRRLAEQHPSQRWRALVMEDSLPGLAAARALGVGCVVLTTSHHAGQLTGDLSWNSFAGHAPAELAAWWRPVEIT